MTEFSINWFVDFVRNFVEDNVSEATEKLYSAVAELDLNVFDHVRKIIQNNMFYVNRQPQSMRTRLTSLILIYFIQLVQARNIKLNDQGNHVIQAIRANDEDRNDYTEYMVMIINILQSNRRAQLPCRGACDSVFQLILLKEEKIAYVRKVCDSPRIITDTCIKCERINQWRNEMAQINSRIQEQMNAYNSMI